jgi:hypothetical protein
MIRRLIALAAAATLGVLPLAGAAQIDPGTQIVGSINKDLSSKSSQVGETFRLTNAHTTNYDLNGATVYGHVTSVTHPGQGRNAQIHLAFDKVNTRSGNVYAIEGYAKDVTVNTKSNAGKELLGAAGGALVGGLIGGGVGALIGAGGGGLYAKNNRQDVTIPSGSLVTVQVVQSRRQATQ